MAATGLSLSVKNVRQVKKVNVGQELTNLCPSLTLLLHPRHVTCLILEPEDEWELEKE